MHAIALAPGELADLLLLIAALEIERADIGARLHGALAELEHIEAAGNFLPHSLVRIERVARLIDIAHVHRIADAQRAAVELFLTRQQAKERGLASAVGSDDA